MTPRGVIAILIFTIVLSWLLFLACQIAAQGGFA